MSRLFDLFKKPKLSHLPKFPALPPEAVKPASALLFYGSPGNRLTEMVGERVYRHKYHPPSFHAAFYVGDGLFLNVGKFKTLEELPGEMRSTRRIDVIEYNLTGDVRRTLARHAMLDTSRPKFGLTFPDYAVTDYLRFLARLWKPSKKDFCSENVVEIFWKMGIQISELRAVDTAPWDLLEFAEKYNDFCRIYTVWTGPDFKA